MPANTYRLTCQALPAELRTTDAATAARWLVDVLATCPMGASVSVLINGQERGARIAARLMSLTETAMHAAIDAETTPTRKAA